MKKYSSREQLYEAIRAIATLPSGGTRGKLKFVFDQLSKEDVKALGDTLLELIYVESPADAMFAEGIRTSSLKLLLKHHFKEGLQASLDLFKVGGRWTKVVIINEWKALGPAVKSLKEGPKILASLKNYNDSKFKSKATDALKAISGNKKTAFNFTSIK